MLEVNSLDLGGLVDVLIGIPEALHMDPEVQRVQQATKRLYTAWAFTAATGGTGAACFIAG